MACHDPKEPAHAGFFAPRPAAEPAGYAMNILP